MEQQKHQDFFQYFSNYLSHISAQSLINVETDMTLIESNIYDLICKGVVECKEDPDTVGQRKALQADIKSKLQEIKCQKWQIMKKLQAIVEAQSKLKETRPMNVAKEKSEITEEDRKLLTRLTKAQRQFQKDLQKKDEQIKDRILSVKRTQKQTLDSERRQKQKGKSLQAQSNMQELFAKSAQRKIKIEESDRLVSQLKNQKHLYQQMEQKWILMEESEKSKIQQLKNEEKRTRVADFDNIKQHQSRYQDFLIQQREERDQKLQQIATMEKKIRECLPAQSSIYRNIKFQDQNRSKQSAFKNALPKIYTEKRLQYGQMVKQTLLPSIKINQSNFLNQVPESQFRSMSTSELYHKGNDYMQAAKKILNKNSIRNSKDDTPLTTIQPSNSSQPDYLQQQRKKNRKPKDQMKELATLIEGDELSSPQKLIKTKNCVQLLDYKVENNPQKLLELINLKLSMLKGMN